MNTEEKYFFSESPLAKTLESPYKEWLTSCILKKIRVYKKSRRWDIFIQSDFHIDSSKIFKLESILEKKIRGIDKVKIHVEYLGGVEWFCENLDNLWMDLGKEMQRDLPSLSRWLNYCRPLLEDKSLKIFINNPMVLELFKVKSVDKYIEKWAYKASGCRYKVKMLLDTSDIKAEREKHYQRIIQEEAAFVKKAVSASQTSSQEVSKNSSSEKKAAAESNVGECILGKLFTGPAVSIDSLDESSGMVIIKGVVFDIESRETKSGKVIYCLDVTDYTNSITAKTFCTKEKADRLKSSLNKGDWVMVQGECQYDKYQREIVIFIKDLIKIAPQEREDRHDVKRVELHLHTQMSAMDGVSPVKSLVARAAKWGHPAIAITDHGVLQAFPDAYAAGKEYGIKIIYGVEAYLINDCKPLIANGNKKDLSQTFIVLDIETTGLNASKDRITEIGAVKIVDKEIVDSFHTFVNPGIPIPPKITELTGITNDMVKDAPSIEEALAKFRQFCGTSALVAHNAPFDIGFIREASKSIDWEITNPIVDTLTLSRELLKDLKKYKLDILAKHLGVKLENHHRASDDARATAEIFIKLIDMLEARGVKTLSDVNRAFGHTSNLNSLESNHAVILAKNKTGLRNLYIMVSKAHLEYFYRRPRIPKSLIMQYREGIIVGSGCEAGELYKAILRGAPYEEVIEIADFYDYLEIQPIDNNRHLIREGTVKNEQDLQKINKQILEIGKKLGKPVVATGDVHFLDPQDEYFRRILMAGQGYSDAEMQPPLYFKTTDEMLEDFSYLGEELAHEVVVDAPRQIAETIEEIQPIPDKLCPPEIPGAEDEIARMAIENAKAIYGDPLPEIVSKRLEKELNSIISHGFAVLYYIAHKLVKKSLSDGYLVGSRGSVGSSFVATMTGITEVNPLPPHYVCPNCKHSDFEVDKSKYGVGVDLPDKDCPMCGTAYNKSGFDIPFEVFLGFKGDKVPDIDLNFSGEYQPIAHKYTEELFGEGHVFRAGTIGTIAEKTAFGFVKKYLEESNKVVTNAEIKRLVAGCTGVKRTTGQHPGGIMVVPKNREIFEFTPIQYPADDKDSGVITTHFDYNFIHDTLVKLDILGHDDPTMIRMLEDITGVDARGISLGEKETMKLFSSTEPLGLAPEDINSPVGTFGVPEFGTRFVRQMLAETRPTTFGELIRISGLSHGTDVWLNNAQDLIRDGIATLSEVISTRDDIMLYLIEKGVEPTIAFNIMERVRKGRGLTEEFEKVMREKDVPEWFIDSCKKIKYMFPKAHACAYVIMAFRIAYFKVYYPEAFYATYFTVRADDFDIDLVLGGKEAIREKIRELESKGNEATAKEKNLITILEVALEMYCRDVKMLPVDLYKSDPMKFLITEEGIRPPLSSLQGLGVAAAKSISEARKNGKFVSIEDLRERARVSKTVIDMLRNHGALDGIPETSQISLF